MLTLHHFQHLESIACLLICATLKYWSSGSDRPVKLYKSSWSGLACAVIALHHTSSASNMWLSSLEGGNCPSLQHLGFLEGGHCSPVQFLGSYALLQRVVVEWRVFQLLLLTSHNFYVRPEIEASNAKSEIKFKAACNALFDRLIHLIPIATFVVFVFCLFPLDFINHIRTVTSTSWMVIRASASTAIYTIVLQKLHTTDSWYLLLSCTCISKTKLVGCSKESFLPTIMRRKN